MGGGIQSIYGALAADADRNALILDDVIRAVHEQRSPVLLTERRDHLEHSPSGCTASSAISSCCKEEWV